MKEFFQLLDIRCGGAVVRKRFVKGVARDGVGREQDTPARNTGLYMAMEVMAPGL